MKRINMNIRKRLSLLPILLASLLVLGGCSKSNSEENALLQQLTGEWHLESWNAETPEAFDAYVVFAADRTFELYQRIEKVSYQRYTGQYALSGTTLSGRYDDDQPWGSDYEISFDEQAQVLTLISGAQAGEISVYVRGAVPDEVRNGAETVTVPSTTKAAADVAEDAAMPSEGRRLL